MVAKKKKVETVYDRARKAAKSYGDTLKEKRLERGQIPPKPLSVGTILKRDFLDVYGVQISPLARTLGVSRVYLSQVINKGLPISPRIAVGLEKVFEPTAEWWMIKQNEVDLWEARYAKYVKPTKKVKVETNVP